MLSKNKKRGSIVAWSALNAFINIKLSRQEEDIQKEQKLLNAPKRFHNGYFLQSLYKATQEQEKSERLHCVVKKTLLKFSEPTKSFKNIVHVQFSKLEERESNLYTSTYDQPL